VAEDGPAASAAPRVPAAVPPPAPPSDDTQRRLGRYLAAALGRDVDRCFFGMDAMAELLHWLAACAQGAGAAAVAADIRVWDAWARRFLANNRKCAAQSAATDALGGGGTGREQLSVQAAKRMYSDLSAVPRRVAGGAVPAAAFYHPFDTLALPAGVVLPASYARPRGLARLDGFDMLGWRSRHGDGLPPVAPSALPAPSAPTHPPAAVDSSGAGTSSPMQPAHAVALYLRTYLISAAGLKDHAILHRPSAALAAWIAEQRLAASAVSAAARGTAGAAPPRYRRPVFAAGPSAQAIPSVIWTYSSRLAVAQGVLLRSMEKSMKRQQRRIEQWRAQRAAYSAQQGAAGSAAGGGRAGAGTAAAGMDAGSRPSRWSAGNGGSPGLGDPSSSPVPEMLGGGFDADRILPYGESLPSADAFSCRPPASGAGAAASAEASVKPDAAAMEREGEALFRIFLGFKADPQAWMASAASTPSAERVASLLDPETSLAALVESEPIDSNRTPMAPLDLSMQIPSLLPIFTNVADSMVHELFIQAAASSPLGLRSAVGADGISGGQSEDSPGATSVSFSNKTASRFEASLEESVLESPALLWSSLFLRTFAKKVTLSFGVDGHVLLTQAQIDALRTYLDAMFGQSSADKDRGGASHASPASAQSSPLVVSDLYDAMWRRWLGGQGTNSGYSTTSNDKNGGRMSDANNGLEASLKSAPPFTWVSATLSALTTANRCNIVYLVMKSKGAHAPFISADLGWTCEAVLSLLSLLARYRLNVRDWLKLRSDKKLYGTNDASRSAEAFMQGALDLSGVLVDLANDLIPIYIAENNKRLLVDQEHGKGIDAMLSLLQMTISTALHEIDQLSIMMTDASVPLKGPPAPLASPHFDPKSLQSATAIKLAESNITRYCQYVDSFAQFAAIGHDLVGARIPGPLSGLAHILKDAGGLRNAQTIAATHATLLVPVLEFATAALAVLETPDECPLDLIETAEALCLCLELQLKVLSAQNDNKWNGLLSIILGDCTSLGNFNAAQARVHRLLPQAPDQIRARIAKTVCQKAKTLRCSELSHVLSSVVLAAKAKRETDDLFNANPATLHMGNFSLILQRIASLSRAPSQLGVSAGKETRTVNAAWGAKDDDAVDPAGSGALSTDTDEEPDSTPVHKQPHQPRRGTGPSQPFLLPSDGTPATASPLYHGAGGPAADSLLSLGRENAAHEPSVEVMEKAQEVMRKLEGSLYASGRVQRPDIFFEFLEVYGVPGAVAILRSMYPEALHARGRRQLAPSIAINRRKDVGSVIRLVDVARTPELLDVALSQSKQYLADPLRSGAPPPFAHEEFTSFDEQVYLDAFEDYGEGDGADGDDAGITTMSAVPQDSWAELLDLSNAGALDPTWGVAGGTARGAIRRGNAAGPGSVDPALAADASPSDRMRTMGTPTMPQLEAGMKTPTRVRLA
jgi:hypothetical protein